MTVFSILVCVLFTAIDLISSQDDAEGRAGLLSKMVSQVGTVGYQRYHIDLGMRVLLSQPCLLFLLSHGLCPFGPQHLPFFYW